ncbi:Hid-1/Ecm30 [Trinorchestia longiramus]|nr:Hid-1/Ecm30 [Trinorchestia longiramus]
MGNADTKLHFRKAVLQLTTKTQPILGSDDAFLCFFMLQPILGSDDAFLCFFMLQPILGSDDAFLCFFMLQPILGSDDAFWNQFWGDHVSSVSDVFVLLPASEVRALRESAPSNLATLCYKAVERLVNAADAGAATHQEHQAVLNCVRILTRVLPYIFEDPDWRGFFWSSLPSEEGGEGVGGGGVEESSVPLAHSLINALCDLLFCPDFTVTSTKKNGPDAHEDLQTLDSCEFIWEAGVGAAHAPPHSPTHDSNRKELLKLILTCCSQIIYQAEGEAGQASSTGGPQLSLGSGTPSSSVNPWLSLFTSFSNRHALPLFTSLLNTVCGYDPVGRGVPYNHLLFTDTRECLVETCLQLLITALDSQEGTPDEEVSVVPDNLFINYLSRIHREEDFGFVLHGFTRLLNNPLQQTYLPHSTKKVAFHQELLVFFWKFCDYNKKFLFYVLKSSEVLEVLVPILFHLNDARADQCACCRQVLCCVLQAGLVLRAAGRSCAACCRQVLCCVLQAGVVLRAAGRCCAACCWQVSCCVLHAELPYITSPTLALSVGVTDRPLRGQTTTWTDHYEDRPPRGQTTTKTDHHVDRPLRGQTTTRTDHYEDRPPRGQTTTKTDQYKNRPDLTCSGCHANTSMQCHANTPVQCHANTPVQCHANTSVQCHANTSVQCHANTSVQCHVSPTARVGLLHIGVFILLLLSGERNFGVRLNKPYTAAVPMDIPVFTGSHADLMIIVFHKIITTGHQRLQPLFDCLLTILVNVSPYIKSLSMVAANKLLHLLEAFCTPWFLFSAPHHHHLVFFLLETFNNIIQYQFDGRSIVPHIQYQFDGKSMVLGQVTEYYNEVTTFTCQSF